MNNFVKKYGQYIMALALIVVTASSRMSCGFCLHQPVEPRGVKNYRGF